jgi:hypothetical protein
MFPFAPPINDFLFFGDRAWDGLGAVFDSVKPAVFHPGGIVVNGVREMVETLSASASVYPIHSLWPSS